GMLRMTRANVLSSAGQLGPALELAQQVLDDEDATTFERVRSAATAVAALAAAGRTIDAFDLIDRTTPLLAADDATLQMSFVIPRIVALATSGRLHELIGLLDLCWSLSDAAGLEDGMAVFAGARGNAALLQGR